MVGTRKRQTQPEQVSSSENLDVSVADVELPVQVDDIHQNVGNGMSSNEAIQSNNSSVSSELVLQPISSIDIRPISDGEHKELELKEKDSNRSQSDDLKQSTPRKVGNNHSLSAYKGNKSKLSTLPQAKNNELPHDFKVFLKDDVGAFLVWFGSDAKDYAKLDSDPAFRIETYEKFKAFKAQSLETRTRENLMNNIILTVGFAFGTRDQLRLLNTQTLKRCIDTCTDSTKPSGVDQTLIKPVPIVRSLQVSPQNVDNFVDRTSSDINRNLKRCYSQLETVNASTYLPDSDTDDSSDTSSIDSHKTTLVTINTEKKSHWVSKFGTQIRNLNSLGEQDIEDLHVHHQNDLLERITNARQFVSVDNLALFTQLTTKTYKDILMMVVNETTDKNSSSKFASGFIEQRAVKHINLRCKQYISTDERQFLNTLKKSGSAIETRFGTLASTAKQTIANWKLSQDSTMDWTKYAHIMEGMVNNKFDTGAHAIHDVKQLMSVDRSIRDQLSERWASFRLDTVHAAITFAVNLTNTRNPSDTNRSAGQQNGPDHRKENPIETTKQGISSHKSDTQKQRDKKLPNAIFKKCKDKFKTYFCLAFQRGSCPKGTACERFKTHACAQCNGDHATSNCQVSETAKK
jgi:hypothetical protein